MKMTVKLSSVFLVLVMLWHCFSFSSVMALESSGSSSSSKVTTDAYISEQYREDPAYALKVQQKQQLAENYYQAFVAGDMETARQYKAAFERMTNPELYQAKILQTNTQSVTRALPSAWSIADLYQVPQERDYWCGCAAAKSILDNIGIEKTQAELASDTYLKAERYDGAPWYISNGNEFSQFPMPNTLVDVQYEVGVSAYSYIPSPLGPAGANPLTVDQCKSYVMITTSAFDDGYGVAACGASRVDKDNYQLPGYPNRRIGHWIVSDGYVQNGDYISIVDPAKSSAVSWSGSISAYYYIPATLFRNFIEPRGMVW